MHYSLGTIGRFGSVVSNGIVFDTTRATITIDDESATEAQLKIGQFAIVSSDVPVADRATATRVAIEHAVIGPVTSTSPLNGTMQVLGQQVIVDSGTSYEGFAQAQPTLNDIAPGEVLAVSGLRFTTNPSEPGQIYVYATRLVRMPASTPLLVRGPIQMLDRSRNEFDMSRLHVVLAAGATLPTSLANSDCVFIRGATNLGATVDYVARISATTVTRVDCVPQARPSDRFVVESRVAGAGGGGNDVRFGSLLAAVDTSGTGTRFDNEPPTALLNRLVRAEGAFDATGRAAASRVAIYGDEQVRVRGAATLSGSALTVLGIPITIEANTRFEDRSTAALRAFSAADLRTGDVVDVRGYQVVGTNTVRAFAIERRPATDTAEIRAFPTDIAAPGFRLLGVPITTDASTRWETYTFGGGPIPFPLQASVYSSPGVPQRVHAICNAPCTTFRAARVMVASRDNAW